MSRHNLFLFLCFAFLFTLFLLFQNFSSSFKKQIRFFRPYSFQESIGNLETPFEYKNSFVKTANVFDHQKQLKDLAKRIPLYNDLKSYLDLSSDKMPSSLSENDCASQDNETKKDFMDNVRVRANPFRQIASISYDGELDPKISYDRGNLRLEVKKEISNKADMNLKVDSHDNSTSFNINLKW